MAKKLTKEQIQALKEVPEEDRADILAAWDVTPMDDDVMESFKKLIGRVDVLEKRKPSDEKPAPTKTWWDRFVGA